MNNIIDYLNNSTNVEEKFESLYNIRSLTTTEIEKFNSKSPIDLETFTLFGGYVSGSYVLYTLNLIDKPDDMDYYSNENLANNKHKNYEIITKLTHKYIVHSCANCFIPVDTTKITIQQVLISINDVKDMYANTGIYDMDICRSFIDIKNKKIYVYKTSKDEVKYYDLVTISQRLNKYKDRFPSYKFTSVNFIPDVPLTVNDLNALKGPVMTYNTGTKKIDTHDSEEIEEIEIRKDQVKTKIYIPQLYNKKIRKIQQYIIYRFNGIITLGINGYQVCKLIFDRESYDDYVLNQSKNNDKYDVIIRPSIYEKAVLKFKTIEDFNTFYNSRLGITKFLHFYEVLPYINFHPYFDIDILIKDDSNVFTELLIKYKADVIKTISDYYKVNLNDVICASVKSKSKFSLHIYVPDVIVENLEEMIKDAKLISCWNIKNNKQYEIDWIDQKVYKGNGLFRLPYSCKERSIEKNQDEYPRTLVCDQLGSENINFGKVIIRNKHKQIVEVITHQVKPVEITKKEEPKPLI